MSLHIITNECFLTCEQIISIVMEDALPEEGAKPKNKKTKKEVPLYCTVSITYRPSTPKNSSYDAGDNLLEIRVPSRKEASSLYTEIVKQVQEQFPSDVFLDKLVNNMLSGVPHEVVEVKNK